MLRRLQNRAGLVGAAVLLRRLPCAHRDAAPRAALLSDHPSTDSLQRLLALSEQRRLFSANGTECGAPAVLDAEAPAGEPGGGVDGRELGDISGRFTVIAEGDAFAKSRVTNCLRRLEVPKVDDAVSVVVFEAMESAREARRAGGDGTVLPSLIPAVRDASDQPIKAVACRCRFHLPREWPIHSCEDGAGSYEPPRNTNEIEAVGVAGTPKDAEIAAAMHAERILERCGFVLFGLSSKQIRHADEQLKLGRLVPLPASHSEAAARLQDIAKSGVAPKPVWVSSVLADLVVADVAAAKSASPCPGGAATDESSPAQSAAADIVKPTGKAYRLRPQAAAKLAEREADVRARRRAEVGVDLDAVGASVSASGQVTIEITLDDDATAASSAQSPGTAGKKKKKKNNSAAAKAATVDGDDEELPEGGVSAAPSTDAARAAAKSQHALIGATPYPYDPHSTGDARATNIDWRAVPRYHATYRVHPLKEKEDETERGKWNLVDFSVAVASDPHTLLTPHYACPESLRRMRAMFKHYGLDFDRAAECSIYHRPKAFERAGGEDATLVLCKVDVPGAEGFVAEGLASSKQVAIMLCAMHAELLTDHLGKRVFPDDDMKQRMHADECLRCGRWASSTVEDETLPTRARHDDTKPKPLREWKATSSGGVKKSGGRRVLEVSRVAPMTPDESFHSVHHQFVMAERSHNVDANPDDADEALVAALRDFCVARGEARELFFLNIEYGSMYRCTFLLPLPLKVYGIRGGYSIGDSPSDARRLAARHAVEVLCHLGIPLYSDMTMQREFDDARRAAGFLVYPRDYDDGGRLLVPEPSPMTRSPPSLRQHGPERPLSPQLETNVALWLDSAVFDKAPVEADDIAWMREVLADYYVKVAGLPMPSPPNCVYAAQPVADRLAAPCNTSWMALPLLRATAADADADEDPEELLVTFAIGRGTTRKYAERSMLVHALRCICHAMIEDDGSSPGPLESRWLAKPDPRTAKNVVSVKEWYANQQRGIAVAKPKDDGSTPRHPLATVTAPAVPDPFTVRCGTPVWPVKEVEDAWVTLERLGPLPHPVMDSVIAARCNEWRAARAPTSSSSGGGHSQRR